MFRIAAALIFTLAFTACGAIDTVKDAFKHVQPVASDLEASTAVRPQVGFDWNMGGWSR